MAAKAVDIAAPRFSIGMGPRVWGFRWGETEYVISALPLGGYVRMAGMADDETTVVEGGEEEEVDPARTFDAKPLWARALVISAGVIMNFLFAVVVFVGLGAAYGKAVAAPVLGEILPDRPAAAAGLRSGDHIREAGGHPVGSWDEFVEIVEASPDRPLALVVERGGVRLPTAVTPESAPGAGEGERVGKIGAGVGMQVEHIPLSPTESVAYGFQRTWDFGAMIVVLVGKLIIGEESLRNLGGPLTIGQVSGEAARLGVETFLSFMAIISVNLAILNLLPIPILDGGHLLFLGIEGVRGKALSVESRVRMSQVGMVMVVALMLWAITNDVLR
ncbi:MAG: RIP metalloprotease RseP, partial [Gemmatimonadota bacterium]|nr:RIP metalloprotease RseP [Gemmatimonadota bacterium]